VRAGAPWRLLPHDFPPWEAVYQQTQRWITAGCFEDIVHDLRVLLRVADGRNPDPAKHARERGASRLGWSPSGARAPK
jgi:transposase